ncbi:MAG: hypothetical protein BWY63_02383 [Chloroflexi bacterium ADurb.Bin360]|nr:MAG: hypothetical protein BWY63_02383 [Chloroflexi bacterium ADurb.Bin360]
MLVRISSCSSCVRLSVLLAISSRVTVMRFSVSVPVLSEQITVTEPRVSTACSLRIKACRCTISRMPSARLMVTTAAKPSGTAAIARPTAIMKASTMVSIVSALMPCARTPLRSTLKTKTTPQMINAPMPSVLPSWSRRICSGVDSSSMVCSISAIKPICVCIPVLTTTPCPRP